RSLSRGASLAHAEQHRPRERAFCRRYRVEQSERQPARPSHKRSVVAENLYKSVGECDAAPPIGKAAARVTLQHRLVAERIPWRVDDRLRELEGITQPDIEPLAGDGVQCLRGVAKNHAPGADGCARVFERERKGAPGLEAGESAHPRRKMSVKLRQEHGI